MKKILTILITILLITSGVVFANNDTFYKNGKWITHTEDCQNYFHDSHMIGWAGSKPGTSSCSCESGYKLKDNKCISKNNNSRFYTEPIEENRVQEEIEYNNYYNNENEYNSQNSKLKGGRCSSDLILHQNLRAPRYGERFIRNGKYDWYAKGVVREAHILQQHLNRLGFSAGKVDGIIGPKTRRAILRLQKYLGTKQDGYVGPKTRELLNNSCSGNNAVYNSLSEDKTRKYSDEDLELSRKIYTKNIGFSKYQDAELSISGKGKINDNGDYLNIDFDLNTESAINWPTIDVDWNLNLDYKFDTNIDDILKDVKEAARGIGVSYRDLMDSDIELRFKIKNKKIYVKLESKFANSIGKIIDDKKIDINGKWIKVDWPEADFIVRMLAEIKDDVEKGGYKGASLYRDNPFIILDTDSERKSGSNYVYNATFDVDNYVRFSKEFGENLNNNEIDALRKTASKLDMLVYVNKYSKELKKIVVEDFDIELDDEEEDFHIKGNLNFIYEIKNASNTRKNSISVPYKFDLLSELTGLKTLFGGIDPESQTKKQKMLQ